MYAYCTRCGKYHDTGSIVGKSHTKSLNRRTLTRSIPKKPHYLGHSKGYRT